MANFPGITLTNSGLDIIAEAQTGKQLIFTAIKLGDGQLIEGQDTKQLTDLISAKLNANISEVKSDGKGQTTLTTQVSNANNEIGFFSREIGIFAKVGADGVEKLYGYSNCGNYTNYIPDKTTPSQENKIVITIITADAANVTAIIDSSIVYITDADLEKHNADTAAHKSIVTVINKKIDDVTEAAKKNGGVTLGTIMPFLVTKIPDGWLSCESGAEVSRTAYPDLWQWVQSNAPILTEENWQAAAKLQTSVGYYSSGDGSTTFRLPRIVDFVQGGVLADSGKFTEAGLPNITFVDYVGNESVYNYGYDTANRLSTVSRRNAASVQNPIYGNSTTVQPASVKMVYCVRAFSAAVNQGTVDITALANDKLSKADIPTLCTGRIVAQSLGETTGWIKYDTGLIWQYGLGGLVGDGQKAEIITLPISFSTMPLSAMATVYMGNGTAAKLTDGWTNSSASVISYTKDTITIVDDYIGGSSSTRQVSFWIIGK